MMVQQAEHPDWVVLSGDERSAFQRALRPEMRRQLVAKFPEFVNYFHCVYDGPIGLHYPGAPRRPPRLTPADSYTAGVAQHHHRPQTMAPGINSMNF
jgi:hypothetical protein